MNVPRSWLEAFVGALPGDQEVVDLLDGLGLAVEAVHHLPAAPAGVVFADIVDVRDVDGSDHLKRVVLDDGSRQHVVVCGAPNATVGLRTALALPGTYLPAVDLAVEVRTVRGVESAGMACSPRELGLYDVGSGIASFGLDAPLGDEVRAAWPTETVFELELTPNRADAFSVLGVARDLAAKLGRQVVAPWDGTNGGFPADVAPPSPDVGADASSGRIEVDDPAAAPCVVLAWIDDVTVGPSPLWLQRRLAAVGLRPRNAVVDVTNYATFEIGQPTHAYDARVLRDGVLQVRRARDGEVVTLLDGAERILDPRDLVIATPDDADGSKAIGLAGVMGGLHDSVKDDTTVVALEVAHFDPPTVRAGAKRNAVRSDASVRFERGVDPALPPRAAAYVARLIEQVSGGTVRRPLLVEGGSTVRPAIDFRPSRVEFLMGFDVEPSTQAAYLAALGCTVTGTDDTWSVVPPTWRFDLSLEEDLIEEVARLHGYEHVGTTRPDLPFTPSGIDVTHRALRTWLAGAGLQETIGYVFTGDDDIERARAPRATVRLSNPQGIERSRLRTALYPGLLSAAALDRRDEGTATFEVGRTFAGAERERLAILLSGPWERDGWRSGTTMDVWRLKGLLERYAAAQRSEVRFVPAAGDSVPMLHPGVAARVLWNGRDVGFAGRIHPSVARSFELGDVYVAELDLPLEPRRLVVEEVPRQPFAERDLAVVAPRSVPYATLESLVRAVAGPALIECFPFDVYTGPPLDEEHRSVAIRLRWRDPERALRDAEVDVWFGAVVERLRTEGYELRG